MDEAIRYIEKQKSYTIAMTNLPILFEKYIKMYSNLTYIKFALGLHPELVGQYREQLSKFISNIGNTKYIGEIGLDYSKKYEDNKTLQLKIFEAIVYECNKFGGKILSIHSRKAVEDVNCIIGNKFDGKVIMHWFSGNKTNLQEAISNGYYFSINHQMVNSNSGRDIIKRIPLDKLLIESDAPFTSKLQSEYSLDFVSEIIEFLAANNKINREFIYTQLNNNFKKVIS
jgi:TatD DNase family protein